jgi:hypothetical protein
MVILACNGVGTPRLMLNSVSAKFPNGIANSSDLVGKNLMFHPYALTYKDRALDRNIAGTRRGQDFLRARDAVLHHLQAVGAD